MSAIKILQPLNVFGDVDGDPLEDGYIYVGVAGLDPVANPIDVFFDEALTVAASQPVRTRGGRPVNSGAAASIYVAPGDYSILIRNKNATSVISRLSGNAPLTPSGTVETTAALIAGRWPSAPAGAIVSTEGYAASGDGGGAQWQKTGVTGLTASQSPADTADGTLTDADGDEWGIVISDSISVKQVGATGDGVTDDAAAINAAVQIVRSTISSSLLSDRSVSVSVEFPTAVYYCASGLNFTNLFAVNVIFEFHGSVIYTAATGTNAIDMLGSIGTSMKDGLLVSKSGAKPTNGVLCGRLNGATGGKHKFINFHTDGYFTRSCHNNFAGEVNYYEKCRWTNRDTGSDARTVVLDSSNWDDNSSDFVTVTDAVGTLRSYQSLYFVSCEFRQLGSQPVLSIRGSGYGFRFPDTYMRTDNVHVVEMTESDFFNILEFDVHAEAATITDWLLVKNDTAVAAGTVLIDGLRIRDTILFPTNSVVKINDNTANTVYFSNINIETSDTQNAIPIFDSGGVPGKLLASGRIAWNASDTLDISGAQFNGDILKRENVSITHTLGAYRIVNRATGTFYQEVKGVLRAKGVGASGNTGYVNYLEMEGSATGNAVALRAGGDDTDVDLNFVTKGAGQLQLNGSTFYEEGTWTPTLNDGTNSATLSVAVGTYTRVGRMVHAKCRIAASDTSSLSGALFLGGLPFTTSSTSNTHSPAVFASASGLSITAGQSVTGYASTNATRITLQLWDATGGSTSLLNTEVTSSTVLVVGITFYV